MELIFLCVVCYLAIGVIISHFDSKYSELSLFDRRIANAAFWSITWGFMLVIMAIGLIFIAFNAE